MGLFRRKEERSFTLADPVFAEYFGITPVAAGVPVNEQTSLGLTAVWRAVSLIAGTCAALPLKTYRETSDGQKQELKSFLDDPAGPLTPLPLTRFEWVETVLAHLLLHGNAYLLHIYGGAGQLVGLRPIPPWCVSVERAGVEGGRLYRVTLDEGTTGSHVIQVTGADLTHILGLATDGVRGYSPIYAARQALGAAIAGETTAGRQFANGAMISGLVTPEDDLTEEEAKTIKDNLRRKILGTENAGDIAVINRGLKFTPWTMSAVDAQFIEQRQFGIAEVSRLYGVPRELLSDTGASSWGSGIQELVRGFLRFTLDPWLTRIEQRLSQLLPAPRFVEFERKALLQGSPQEEIDLIVAQLDAGLLTLDEARALLNRPPALTGPETAPSGPGEGVPVESLPG